MDVDFGDIQSSGGNSGSGGGGDDITSDLLQKFSCMNTTDREVLIQQFKVLLGDKCSETNAEFWLDMNNWNLQAAVCSYFDYESQNSTYPYPIKLPSMSFISDGNFNDRMPPNTPYTYHCIVTNSGDEPWPLGCSLRFCGGTQMSNEERVLLPSLNPGQSAEVKLSMISPDSAGGHQCQWRPATLTGQFFGETIFIIVNVIDDLQSVTQQLCDAHLMDADQNPASLSLPLSSSTVVPLGASSSPTHNLQHSHNSPNLVSSLSSSLPSQAAVVSSTTFSTTSLMNGINPCAPSPNNFTSGMCMPGSTVAGFLPPPEGTQHPFSAPSHVSSSLQNGSILFDHAHTAQSQHQQQLMLTHLSPNQLGNLVMNNHSPPAPPPSAAASHESVDDSSMS